MSEEQNPKTQNAAEDKSGNTASNDSSAEVFTLPANTLNYGLVALISLVVGIAIGAFAFGGGSVDEATLRDVLREELSSLEFAGGTTDYLADDDPYIGPEDAPVVMVEFSDFLCGFCGRHFQQTLQPLLERYEGHIRYVYRDFPVIGGETSYRAALAAECAADQGEFWEYHNLLFDNQSALSQGDTRGTLVGFAQNLGLDMDAFSTCYDSEQHQQDIRLDLLDAQSIGASGTPAFYINGRFVSGAQGFDTFAAIIDNELSRAGIDPNDLG